jgi:RimJ/RimL family protein N-acetyltransferase
MEQQHAASTVAPISLDGRYVRLRPITRADYGFLWQCRSHPDVMHLWTSGRSIPGFEQYTQEIEAGLAGQFLTLLLIETADGQRPVGFVFAYDYSASDRYAFFNIVLAPPFSQFWWGAEAVYLFLDYLFGFFDLRKACAEVFDFNEHPVALLLRSGAAQEGRFRQQHYYQGRYHDVIRVGLLSEEWVTSREQLAKLLTPPAPEAEEGGAAEEGAPAAAAGAAETLAELAGEAGATPAVADVADASRRAPRGARRNGRHSEHEASGSGGPPDAQ